MCSGSFVCSCHVDGVMQSYGPVQEDFWKRFKGGSNPNGDGRTVEDDLLFNPVSGFPVITVGGNFRQASPAGKIDDQVSSAEQVERRLVPMDFWGTPEARPFYLSQVKVVPIEAGYVTNERVDAWGSSAARPAWDFTGDIVGKATG